MALKKTFITLFLLGMVIVSTFAYSVDTDVIAIAGTEPGILLWSPQQPNKGINIHLSDQEERGLIFNLRTSTQLQERLVYLAIYDSDAISETTRSSAKKAVINMLNPYDTSTSDTASETARAMQGIVIGTVPVVLVDDGTVRLVLRNGWETVGVGIRLRKEENNFIRFLPFNSPTVFLLNPQQPNQDVNVPLEAQQGLHTFNQALKTSKQSQKQQFVLGSIVLENDGTLSLLTLDKRVIIRPSVHEEVQDMLMSLAIAYVDPSKVVQARGKEILEKADTDYIRKTLVQLATAEWYPEEVRARAKETVLKTPLGIGGQFELLDRAIGEDPRVPEHLRRRINNAQIQNPILTRSEYAREKAREILLEKPPDLQIQETLMIKALSDPLPPSWTAMNEWTHLDKLNARSDPPPPIRARARDVLINVELDYSIQEELVSIATGFLRPHQKRDLFDRLYSSFFRKEESLQNRAQEILIERKALDLEIQQELVRLATSDVVHAIVHAIARTRAQEILIERKKALDLEVQQELVRLANSDTFLPRIRARNILSQLRVIHPRIAKSMGLSLKCRRAFRRWAPSFAVAQ